MKGVLPWLIRWARQAGTRVLYPALQRKSHLCIPFLGIARPQPQFQPSCVWQRFILSQDWSTSDRLWKYINFSQTHDCGHWDRDPEIPFWEYLFRKFGILSLQCALCLVYWFLQFGNSYCVLCFLLSYRCLIECIFVYWNLILNSVTAVCHNI